jgi:succinate-semialdehyde dehydrogenase/glutarate-semialdehyde dehydrogenase
MLDTVTNLPLKDSSLLRQSNLLDGQWIGADSGETVPVTNPANGAVIGTVPAMGTAETRRAIEAAHRAQPAWRGLLAKERSAILRRLFNLMIENQDDLAAARSSMPRASSNGSPRRRSASTAT